MARPTSLYLRFFAIAGTISLLATYYTATCLNSSLPQASPWRFVVWGIVGLSWGFPILRFLTIRLGRGLPFQNAGFYLIGLASSVLVVLLLISLLHFSLHWSSIPWPSQAPLAAAALCVALSLLGIRSALRGPAVKKIQVPVKGLAPDLAGLRIVQISDLHIGSLLGKSYVQKVVDQVLALQPDLIAITGDLIDGAREELQDTILPLAGLKAPLGVHYVTGNHEYLWGVEGWLDDFRRLGFEVLENQHRVLKRGSASLRVIGINDLSAERFGPGNPPNLDAAMKGAPEADFTLFLAHQPQAYRMAEKIPCDLMLAGHTHAGQFLPVAPIVRLFHRYFRGLYRHEGNFWIYINPGTGFWGPPNRLGVRSETTLLELVPG